VSVVSRGGEKIGKMYGCGRRKVLVNAITNTNRECNEKSYESNYAKGEVACSCPNTPQGHYECMDGDYLVGRMRFSEKPEHVKGCIRE
jgi:hypothetical protein